MAIDVGAKSAKRDDFGEALLRPAAGLEAEFTLIH